MGLAFAGTTVISGTYKVVQIKVYDRVYRLGHKLRFFVIFFSLHMGFDLLMFIILILT